MTHNLSFRYHADMTTKGLGLALRLGLGSAKSRSTPIFNVTLSRDERFYNYIVIQIGEIYEVK